MQKTSPLYKRLFNDPAHWTETRLVIQESGVIGTEQRDIIAFADVAISADAGAEDGYDESKLISIHTSKSLFDGSEIKVGACIAGEIDVVMQKPDIEIPRQAQISPYIRLNNGKEQSEWLQKGVYYIDQRPETGRNTSFETIHITGYDAILKTEQAYPESRLNWPARDIDVVREIAKAIEVNIDPETIQTLKGYLINFPADYTCRETLSFIAAMYAGWWIINNVGELRLITLTSLPEETRLLVDEDGNRITFGGDRINV